MVDGKVPNCSTVQYKTILINADLPISSYTFAFTKFAHLATKQTLSVNVESLYLCIDMTTNDFGFGETLQKDYAECTEQIWMSYTASFSVDFLYLSNLYLR